MTSDDSRAASAESLERLITLAPDPDRAERVRARCRTQLGQSRQPAPAPVVTGFAWQVLAPLAVGGFCILYAALLAATTLRFQG